MANTVRKQAHATRRIANNLAFNSKRFLKLLKIQETKHSFKINNFPYHLSIIVKIFQNVCQPSSLMIQCCYAGKFWFRLLNRALVRAILRAKFEPTTDE